MKHYLQAMHECPAIWQLLCLNDNEKPPEKGDCVDNPDKVLLHYIDWGGGSLSQHFGMANKRKYVKGAYLHDGHLVAGCHTGECIKISPEIMEAILLFAGERK